MASRFRLQIAMILQIILCMLLITSPAIARDAIRIVDGFVSKVSDGNNVTVVTKNREKLKVRMYGIDAPELDKINRKTKRIIRPGQPFGIEAKSHLSSMVFGQDVRLAIMDIDTQKRMVAVVWVREKDFSKNVNIEMLKAGMAEAYTEYLIDEQYRNVFLEAEKEAREKKIGIWSLGLVYERPSVYRNK
jgi:endonuclease YncB( thermonuclease family)